MQDYRYYEDGDDIEDDYIPNQRRVREIYEGKIAMGGRGKSKKSKAAAARNPWIEHVFDYAYKHDVSYRDALSEAGPSYRKLTGTKKTPKKKVIIKRAPTRSSYRQSGSKTAKPKSKSKVIGWNKCRTARAAHGMVGSAKESAKYYCKSDKLCYRTIAAKKKKCKVPKKKIIRR